MEKYFMLREKYPKIWKECHSIQERPAHLQIKKSKVVNKDDEPTDEELDET